MKTSEIPTRSHKKTQIAFAIACALTSASVFAQQQEAAAEEEQLIEVINVTAQKRVSTLQETPIAITAFNPEAIENYQIEDINDIGGLSPNVRAFAPIGSTFNIGMNIRGLGTAEPSLAIDPKVGIYLDGVYLARNSGAIFDIVDLARVEVLRGPQGTLWGKNTTGGALNLVTKKPSEDFEFKQMFTLGSNDEFNSTTSIDTGAFGNFTARLTYMTREHDGWATNTFEGAKYKELGAEEADAYRVALRYSGDDFTIDYAYDNTDGSSVPIPTQVSNVRPFFTDPTVPTQNLGNGTLYAGNTFAMMAANEYGDGRQEEFQLDSHGPEHVEILGHTLTFEWDFSDDHTLKYIGSKRKYDSLIEDGIDLDGGAYFGPALDFSTMPPGIDFTNISPLPGFTYKNDKYQEQDSHELQLLGEFMQGDLKYVAGYYKFSEEGQENNPWSISIFTGQGANLLFTEPFPFGTFYKVTADSTALFGNVDYSLTDKLNVVAGIRYTEDERSLTNLAEFDAMLREDLFTEEDWSKTVGSLLLNYVHDSDMTLYASIQQGYASGVYNPGSIDRFAVFNPANMGQANYEGTLTPADPEDTTSYELGMKSMLLDGRLMFNTALFFNDNDNLQRTVLDGNIRRSVNTGKSETVGIEIDAQFAVTSDLRFMANLGYLDTDYSDETLKDESTYTGSLALNWDIAETKYGNVNLHVDYLLVDEFQFTVTDPTLVADSYQLLNARLSLADIELGDRSTMKVSLWGRNITDKEYVVHGANFSFFNALTYGAPAHYGVDIRFNY